MKPRTKTGMALHAGLAGLIAASVFTPAMALDVTITIDGIQRLACSTITGACSIPPPAGSFVDFTAVSITVGTLSPPGIAGVLDADFGVSEQIVGLGTRLRISGEFKNVDGATGHSVVIRTNSDPIQVPESDWTCHYEGRYDDGGAPKGDVTINVNDLECFLTLAGSASPTSIIVNQLGPASIAAAQLPLGFGPVFPRVRREASTRMHHEVRLALGPNDIVRSLGTGDLFASNPVPAMGPWGAAILCLFLLLASARLRARRRRETVA